MNNRVRRVFVVAVFIVLCGAAGRLVPLHAAVLLSDYTPLLGFKWTLEKTSGYMSLSRVMLDGEQQQATSRYQSIKYSGALFSLYIDRLFVIRSNLNFGFTKKPFDMVWSNLPDFLDNVCVFEHDLQVAHPVKISWRSTIMPFGGYSFLDYSLDVTKISAGLDSLSYYNQYQTVMAGLEYVFEMHHWLHADVWLAYSPVTLAAYQDSYITYISYGGHIIVNTKHFGMNLYAAGRNNFQVGRTSCSYALNVGEYGVSFRFSVW